MRTKLRSKFTLLFACRCAVLIAVPAVAALADIVRKTTLLPMGTARSRRVALPQSTTASRTIMLEAVHFRIVTLPTAAN